MTKNRNYKVLLKRRGWPPSRLFLVILIPLWVSATCPLLAQDAIPIHTLSVITPALEGRVLDLHGIVLTHAPQPAEKPHELVIGDGASVAKILIPDKIWASLSSARDVRTGVPLDLKVKLIDAKGPIPILELQDAANIRTKLLPLNVALQLPRRSGTPADPARTQSQQTTAAAKLQAEENASDRLPQAKPAVLKQGKSLSRSNNFWAVWLAVGLGIVAVWLAWRERRAHRALINSVSEREHADEALKRGHARLSHLLSANSGVIYTIRLMPDRPQDATQLTFLSENVEQLLGYEPEHCIRTPGWWLDSVHPDDRKQLTEGTQSVLKLGVLDREYRMRRRDGSYVYVHDRQRLLRDNDGRPHEIVGTWMDVTDRKWAEKMKEVFASLGVKLSAASTSKEVGSAILRSAELMFGWDSAYVNLYDEQRHTMRSILMYDVYERGRQEVPKLPDEIQLRPLTQKVLTEGPQLLLRANGDPGNEELDTFGEKQRLSASLMFAPIRHKNKPIGILSVQSYTPRAYQPRDLQLLQILANYCSAALVRTFAEEERKQAEEALRDSEQRYALALKGANDGLWDWDFRQNSVYYSPRWKSMLGFSEQELTDSPDELINRIHPDDANRVKAELAAHLQGKTPQLESQYRIHHKDGTYRWMLMRGVAVRDSDGNPMRMAGSQTDITQRRRAEEQLVHGAYYDALTGLPNRLFFSEQLRRAMGRHARHSDYLFGVLFLDLDRFKVINDSLGHVVGDKLLVNVAARLKTCVRPEDTVARLGGDEFTVLLEDLEDEAQATRVAERIQEDLSKPVHLDGHDVWSTASIGIALSTSGYEKPEEILRDADAAMYRAKAKGKARHEMFDRDMHARAVALLQMEADLRRALERDELRVHYQPLVNLRTRSLLGFEALVRWQHPERGLVAPLEFIPLAEETGLIVPIGWWVLREACSQLQAWQKNWKHNTPLTMSVNFSRKQFAQPDLLPQLQQVLTETELPADCLALEITESVLMENADSLVSLLERLKAMHVQLHIDDFGTGYSSLSYLDRFPIDKVKIDRSFVARMTPEGGNAEIVRAIITMAGELGLGVIAEGIEVPEHATVLADLKCEVGQGYYFDKPLEPDAATEWLESQPVNEVSSEAGLASYGKEE